MMWRASIIGTPMSMDSEFVSETLRSRMLRSAQNVCLESCLSCASRSGGLKWLAQSIPAEVV